MYMYTYSAFMEYGSEFELSFCVVCYAVQLTVLLLQECSCPQCTSLAKLYDSSCESSSICRYL